MNCQLYHITHINNLRGIVNAGGLLADSQRLDTNIENKNIGYNHIKARRLQHAVYAANKGVIGDYVPFNFCPRSVMLYVVSKGHADYSGGQDDILHLVTTVERVQKVNQSIFFTDIHADLSYAEQIEDFTRLPDLNWNAINKNYWQEVKEEKQSRVSSLQTCSLECY